MWSSKNLNSILQKALRPGIILLETFMCSLNKDELDNFLFTYNNCELTDQLCRDQDIKKSCYEKFLELFSQKNYGRRYVKRVKERMAALE